MIDRAAFKWLVGERVWIHLGLPGSQLEIVIAGDEQGPQAARVSIAEEALEQIGEVRQEAIAHLDAFIDRTKFARNSEWYLDGLEFGREGDEPVGEFRAYFSLEDDPYGLWSVLLRTTDQFGVVPVEFSRRQD